MNKQKKRDGAEPDSRTFLESLIIFALRAVKNVYFIDNVNYGEKKTPTRGIKTSATKITKCRNKTYKKKMQITLQEQYRKNRNSYVFFT